MKLLKNVFLSLLFFVNVMFFGGLAYSALKVAGGNISLAAAQTWTALQTFTNLDATGVVSLGGTHASTEAGVELEKITRVSGGTTGATTGQGVEFAYITGEGFINSYNRTGASYDDLYLDGSPLNLNSGSVADINIRAQSQFYSRTSAQLAALAPSSAGRMVYNSTLDFVCRSTGTGTGAWVAISSYTIASLISGAFDPMPCD